MSVVAAAAAAGAVAALLLSSDSGRRRLSAPSIRHELLARWQPRPASPRAGRLHQLAAVVVSVALLLVLGVPWGLPFAIGGLAVVPVLLSRLESAEVRRRRDRIVADLPLAVDLLAACLRAGRPPGEALVAVAGAVGGPLGERLSEVEQRLRLGADPADAWRLLDTEPACAPLARAVQRTLVSGGPLAQTLDNLAVDVRQQRRWTADERARAVETRSVVPLGLCFLPAFVLIGIVPTIAGSLSSLFTVFAP
jgi:Flp pilus assembly protein TadB